VRNGAPDDRALFAVGGRGCAIHAATACRAGRYRDPTASIPVVADRA
jgi:hypothetical protein